MINSLTLRYFRKHEDTHIDFTNGLNVLRGPNEIGKTTVTEGILYALYGAAALVDTLADVVTWGHKESELKVKLVMTIDRIVYTFTRSKAGAECNYTGTDGMAVKVVGQKEVTAFAAALLGADAKTASVLMLSSQAGLRGALDEGATAVSALMAKLADFEMIDRILRNAAETLSLGAVAPVQTKLDEAHAVVAALQAAQPDTAAVGALEARIEALQADQEAASATAEELSIAVGAADDAREAAVAANRAYDEAARAVDTLTSRVRTAQQNLENARQAAAKRVPEAEIEAARVAVSDAEQHASRLALYQAYKPLEAYPEVAWDSDKLSFDVEFGALTQAHAKAQTDLNASVAAVAALERSLIAGDGVCPTCKRAADNHDHVQQHNLSIQGQIAAQKVTWPAMKEKIGSAQSDLALFSGITKAAEQRQRIINKVAAHVSLDESVYPCRVTWTSPIPPTFGGDVTALRAALRKLQEADQAAVQAEGMVTAHQATYTSLGTELHGAMTKQQGLAKVEIAPLDQAYEAAFQAYSAQSARVREIGFSIQALKGDLEVLVRRVQEWAARFDAAQARVVELGNDIKKLEFNNELVRKLKSMKPMITDHLWNNVLSAVSNFFSTLRGEQSIVTKDATGFKVNGRGGSLSGSTLDMLALAIRVALSKTFVPHANFMVLDEPAHGCDNVRASALLGFLAGAGFNQIILASHDELSESVANNVIALGA